MIPKIIHYCWFGRSELPEMACQCIASWRKYFPGYEIKEWNEDNFDVMSIPYTAEAYRVRKFAFVSDYARFKILYDNGGIYFDTDVEVVKPMDDIVAAGAYMGMERDCNVDFTVNSGLGMAAPKGLPAYEDVLDKYATLHFIKPDGTLDKTTTVTIVTSTFLTNGLKPRVGIIDFDGIRIYPPEFFNPLNSETKELNITANTRTIHHYTGSWHNRKEKFVHWTRRHFGIRASQVVSLLEHNPVYVVKRVYQYFRRGK